MRHVRIVDWLNFLGFRIDGGFRDDMGDSYGAAYTTRSADEGYGERYGEAVKKVLDKKAEKEEHVKEVQRGMTADRDQSLDAGTTGHVL